jgi:hypothetical protein
MTSMKESAVTEQRPEVHPGFGEDLAEDNGFAEQARELGQESAAAGDPTQPPDEASTPV